MAVVFTEDYSGCTQSGTGFALPAGWTLALSSGTPTIGAIHGGCGWGNGISGSGWISGSRMVSCLGPFDQATHPFTPCVTDVSLRSTIAFKADAPGNYWEPFRLVCPGALTPGFVFNCILRGDGSISIRSNEVTAETLTPSSPGVFPVDGTPCTLQYRLHLNSVKSVTVSADINDTTVWTHTYTATDNFSHTDKWSAAAPPGADGCGTQFTHVQLAGFAGSGYTRNTAIGPVTIDNSSAHVTMGAVCAGFPTLGTARPVAVVTGIDMVAGSRFFTVHGTNFRAIEYSYSVSPVGFLPPGFYLKKPDGTQLDIGVGIDYPVTYAATSITGTLTDPAVEGNWCGFVANSRLCWEAPASPSPETEGCFTIGPPTPPSSPCYDPTNLIATSGLASPRTGSRLPLT